MRRLTAYVSGKFQKAAYRTKVAAMARDIGVNGFTQDLPGGRVKVIAEGSEPNLDRFSDALKINDAFIDVTDIQKGFRYILSRPGWRFE